MERPALKRLLVDIQAGKVQTVVVYKVDRLTRALTDFSKIIEIFDSQKVSFVSVTQNFNTTSSMGRLTLNVLLSFAQFEREITGERIRDKIAASKKKGMWMGGLVPLGYDCVDRQLVINAVEAQTEALGSRKFILALLLCSFALSLIAIYNSSNFTPKTYVITSSAYSPAYPSPIQVIKDKTFQDTTVPLDGYDYDHDTFNNVCFLYDGGSYELQNVTLKNHCRLCVKDDRLKNYSSLMDAFKLFDPRIIRSTRAEVR